MIDSRREFLKKAALLASSGLSNWPDSIQKAFAIDPQPGTTYLDAEHVVILMQENRSFDHLYGALQGVRGFNDPRAFTLPNDHPVWLQTNAKGETYAPFRLNMHDTKATWMSSLPHSWENQVDALNGGQYNRWLDAKQSGRKEYAKMPLTMGYYNRQDLPFYYALADAFTVCDQSFCSSLTGTTPNRLYFWTGTVRDPRNPAAMANVRNENVDYEDEVSWMTFPERLQDAGVSWKIYQNEISLSTGLSGEEDGWLSNFTDNPIEWFTQYRVRFHPAYYRHLQQEEKALPDRLKALEAKLSQLSTTDATYVSVQKNLQKQRAWQQTVQHDLVAYSPDKFSQLPEREQQLCRRAFTTNTGDPDYRSLATLTYQDGDVTHTVDVPKGDVLHQFRQDVKLGTLPTVSWVVAPENFSDHPSAPWYGAWYLSEMLDILTQKPEVWQKTIFILAYDENDGYFDHIPPFVPAHPDRPHTGQSSKGIDTRLEFVTPDQEANRKGGGRTGPIGLGYRVPLVIVSPWSRGGYVNSEVFDHTSTLQLLEKLISHKTGRQVQESNISTWRRTVCGDLSSAFRPYKGESIKWPAFVAREPFIEGIHKAQFKAVPANFQQLTQIDIQQCLTNPKASPLLPKQESGIRPACALPYELYVDGHTHKGQFVLTLSAGNKQFGKRSAGAPFQVSRRGGNDMQFRSYTVAPGDTLTDNWPLDTPLQLCVQGPNGFYREFKGNRTNPPIKVGVLYERDAKNRFTGHIIINLTNTDSVSGYAIQITDNSYGTGLQTIQLDKTAQRSITLNLSESHNWYDFSIHAVGFSAFEQRYAGRVETGKVGFTDPLIGQIDTVASR
ncbi:phosphocholine-specific phospholipase C [Fibrella aquatica]|uniref:phosphocholine-specific phospholipase C n=1 Tax=Fibrella aquatica TaxID=3242487 RepID=UPI00351FA652